MAGIGARLIDGADAVKPRRRGSAETGQLRKDEPHPMRSLPARAQFGEHGCENRRLRRYETLQIEIGRCHRHLKLTSFTLLLYTSFIYYWTPAEPRERGRVMMGSRTIIAAAISAARHTSSAA